MIKKIINWTASGFFRKLGSILVYIAIISIVAILSLKKGITIEKLLGIEQVYAETTGTYSSLKFEVQQCTVNGLIWGTCQNDSRNGMGSNNSINFGSDNGHLKKIQMQLFGGSNITYPMGNYNITVRIAKDPLILDEIRNVYQIKIFGNTSSSSNGADSSQNTISSKSCELEQVSQYVFDVKCLFSTNKDLKYIMISLEADELVPDNTDVIYWYSIPQFTYTTDATGAINNQTTIIQNEFNETNQNITEIKDVLSDDNVSEQTTSAINFFNNFNLSNHAFLVNLILLPVDFLNSLVVGSTNDLCFDFRGQHICLPNGQTTLWQKNYSGCHDYSLVCATNTLRDNFASLFNLVVGGYITYKLISKLIKIYHRSLDPTKDNLEVIKL